MPAPADAAIIAVSRIESAGGVSGKFAANRTMV
jgi:hypothetical protein